MRKVHPTAVVDGAVLGEEVEVGPFAVVEEGAIIGDGTIIGPHAIIRGCVRIGKNCRIGAGALLGGDPQSIKFNISTKTYVKVGDNVFIGEYTVIHRATEENEATEVGSNAFIMGQSHIGHDCKIGERAVLTTFTGLAGHVIVEEGAVLGASVGVHQFCRIGKLAMVAAVSKVGQDIVPFMVAQGWPAKPIGVNLVGLKRAGIPEETRMLIKRAFKLLFKSGLDTSTAISEIEKLGSVPELEHIVEFIKNSGRGIAK